MQDLERIQDRLDRIESIQPVLAALRTISLASWRQALRQRGRVQDYTEGVQQAMRHLPTRVLQKALTQRRSDGQRRGPGLPIRRVVLVLGSERGLCGRFNLAAVEQAERLLAEELPAGSAVELAALGSRIGRMLGRRGHPAGWTGKLSMTALPPFELASELAGNWLSMYEEGTLDEVHLVYNDYSGLGQYRTRQAHLIPPSGQVTDGAHQDEPDPPAIIETDAQSLHQHLVAMHVAARLHEFMIRSAAAEHSTRFQLMDGASQNAERIIAELALAVQSARQQSITRDMQELAAGAGLIGQRVD